MAAMTVTLTPEQAAQVEQLLAEGWFTSIEEAVAHSIDLLSRETHLGTEMTGAAQARIQHGIEAAARGELVPQAQVETFFSDWERSLRG